MATNDAAQDSPDSLDLKKRARRRLVGAAALALLAVVILPMVMDSEPKPVAQDIQIRIPSQDGNTPKVFSNKPAATPLPAPQETLLPQGKPDEAVAAIPRDAKTDAKAEAAPEAKATTAGKDDGKADVKSKPDVKPETKPETTKAPDKAEKAKAPEKTQDKASDKPADKAVAKKAEETRAAAALEGKSESKASAAGQWVVQLGAYQNAGNVKLLMAKLKELGVPAYTEKLDGPDGAKTRVRAGPFASKEEAEKAQGRIKIIGVTGPVGQK
ncbi:SPOR domain-containing protein [Denitratisoma sp. agr-D3]